MASHSQRLLFAFLLFLSMGCSTGRTEQQQTQAIEKGKGTRSYSEIYDSGQVKIKGTMVDGERHGLWVSYFENGLKWSEENYYMGAKDGKAVTYYPNGMLRFRGTYVDDEKAGMWTFYDEEGKIVKEVDFNEK